jgi:hypothetical protein
VARCRNYLEIVADFLSLREEAANWQFCLLAIIFMHEDWHVEFWHTVHRLMPVREQKPVGRTQRQYLLPSGGDARRVVDNEFPCSRSRMKDRTTTPLRKGSGAVGVA